MPQAAPSSAAAGFRVHDLTARRIERALGRRQRYRYVHPVVQAHEDGWFIISPCCSRNVDPRGGDIPIAWFQPLADAWALHRRDHARQAWNLHATADTLGPLLDTVCLDEARIFWP